MLIAASALTTSALVESPASALHRPTRRERVLSSSPCMGPLGSLLGAIPGAAGSSNNNDADFRKNPAGFCEARLQQDGSVFEVGGTTFVGGDAALAALADADTSDISNANGDGSGLTAPFALAGMSGESEPFGAYAEAFNRVCYDSIFLWIPRYKEAGFSTFRFEDFVDGRVRRLLPSMRTMVFKAVAPTLLQIEGGDPDKLASALGFESFGDCERAYAAHAVKLRPLKVESLLPSLFDLEALEKGGAGDPATLAAGLEAYARRSGSGSSGAALLTELTSTVEQVSALACNMICAAHQNRGCLRALEAEQSAVLKGSGPDAIISAELLEQMPKLEAFTREVLRTMPPCRPGAVTLKTPLELPATGGSKPTSLAAGARVSAEPFVAHFDPAAYSVPSEFKPERFEEEGRHGEKSNGHSLIALSTSGASSADAAAGGAVAVIMAKVIAVQLRRMFEDVILGDTPSPKPYGYPLHTIGEKVEVLMKPKMYYELQRGVKKLRF